MCGWEGGREEGREREDLGMGVSVSSSEMSVTGSELLFVLFHVPPVGVVHKSVKFRPEGVHTSFKFRP